MTNLSQLENEISNLMQSLTCPYCRHDTKLLALVNPEKQDYRYVRCCTCRDEFPLTGAHLMVVKEAEARLAANLGQVRCPHCHTRQFHFEFRCDLRDGSCFFLAHCQLCGHVFRVIEYETHLELAAFG